MLKHLNTKPVAPRRVVVLGSRGFVGSVLVRRLEIDGIDCLPISSADLDLTSEDASARLTAMLRSDDAVVILSAITRERGLDAETTRRNLQIGSAVAAAVKRRPPAHVVYISSDGVYPYSNPQRLSESSPTAPEDPYCVMHLQRELMIRDASSAPLAILRLTGVYGVGDTHSSYGPNRFRRQAAAEGRIVLFGQGEETRDHLLVDDGVALIRRVLDHRSAGVLNLATGYSATFLEVAKLVSAQFDQSIEISFSPRKQPITYRSFDVSVCRTAFPEFSFTPLEKGIALAHSEIHAPQRMR